MRADLNVPLEDGEISDDTRIRAVLPTIENLRERGASVVLVSHLGRPKGPDPSLSMKPVSDRIGELTEGEVRQAPAVVGDEVEEMAGALEAGEVLVLENSRFEEGETR
ncbi:MAG TPA: phosphoglycerate kinase, partial [Acidimicrobiales bacterium]|nr:phosphoglycerate kinase [Acidimicrobiales bacterium]